VSCDCQMPSAFRSETRRARKSHRCDECYTPILPGETYEYVSGIWDGEPDSHHFHAACSLARHQFEVYVREAQKAARERLRLAERPYATFVEAQPARTTTPQEDAAELKAARHAVYAIEDVCDCVPYGHLGETMREYALEVLGYDTKTGLPPPPRPMGPFYEKLGAMAGEECDG